VIFPSSFSSLESDTANAFNQWRVENSMGGLSVVTLEIASVEGGQYANYDIVAEGTSVGRIELDVCEPSPLELEHVPGAMPEGTVVLFQRGPYGPRYAGRAALCAGMDVMRQGGAHVYVKNMLPDGLAVIRELVAAGLMRDDGVKMQSTGMTLGRATLL
jgi:hypothetical protein